MHPVLGAYGSRLNGHRVVKSEQLEKCCLIWELPNQRSVGVFLEYLQIQCLESAHLRGDTFAALGKAALAGLRSAHCFEIRVHGVTWMSHLQLAESQAPKLLSETLPSVRALGLGNLATSGVTYVYEPTGERLSTSLNLQRSTLYDGALYVKIDFIWDGKLEYEAVVEESARLISETIADLVGVEVPS